MPFDTIIHKKQIHTNRNSLTSSFRLGQFFSKFFNLKDEMFGRKRKKKKHQQKYTKPVYEN